MQWDSDEDMRICWRTRDRRGRACAADAPIVHLHNLFLGLDDEPIVYSHLTCRPPRISLRVKLLPVAADVLMRRKCARCRVSSCLTDLFSTTASFFPCCSVKMRLTKVVLPATREPVIVTGTFAGAIVQIRADPFQVARWREPWSWSVAAAVADIWPLSRRVACTRPAAWQAGSGPNLHVYAAAVVEESSLPM